MANEVGLSDAAPARGPLGDNVIMVCGLRHVVRGKWHDDDGREGGGGDGGGGDSDDKHSERLSIVRAELGELPDKHRSICTVMTCDV